CHLTPNFHFAGHVVEYIHTYGPAYAWWVFPYERAIGVLGKANHNGHGSGEVEGTYMQAWWKTMLIQELVGYSICLLLFSLFADSNPVDTSAGKT
ncbi:hypothetical protein EDB19DRAFT_1649245, partial [Suillus lakei]